MIMRNYEIKTDLESMQLKEICKLLKQTTWAATRSEQTIKNSLEHSLCMGRSNKHEVTLR